MIKINSVKWGLAAALLSSGALAPTSQAKTAKKSGMKVVTVCPVMQHPVPKNEANAVVVGNTKAYVCCGGCKGKFQAMSTAQKKQALRSAMKKQADKKA
jgi:hypothetical protein